MKRRSEFEIYLRTGRRMIQSEPVETKFNPWHDPDDGRFTFAGQGNYFGGRTAESNDGGIARTSGASQARPARASAPAPAPRPKIGSSIARPKRQSVNTADINPMTRLARSIKPRQSGPNQDSATPLANYAAAVDRMRRDKASVRGTPLRPVPGYPEEGSSSWRASNDRAFLEAAKKFNAQRGLKPGNPKYIDPLLIKAWAMVESGGSRSEFLSDPLQVNVPGDWSVLKQRMTGLYPSTRR